MELLVQKKSKYNNKKLTIDGHTFDSEMEARYYQFLKAQKALGKIADFELQPKFELLEAFKKDGKSYRKIEYVADFLVHYKNGRSTVVDVKGQVLPLFKLKEKLFHYKYPELNLQLLSYSNIDGGWIELDDLIKARKLRKKLKEGKKISKK
mgnify:FL=1